MDIQDIKKYMKANKITYDDLAERSKLSISTIKKIFSGVSQYPRIDTMQAIERALGLDNEIPTIPDYNPSEEEKALLSKIMSMTEEEVDELSNIVDYILSKRK